MIEALVLAVSLVVVYFAGVATGVRCATPSKVSQNFVLTGQPSRLTAAQIAAIERKRVGRAGER